MNLYWDWSPSLQEGVFFAEYCHDAVHLISSHFFFISIAIANGTSDRHEIFIKANLKSVEGCVRTYFDHYKRRKLFAVNSRWKPWLEHVLLSFCWAVFSEVRSLRYLVTVVRYKCSKYLGACKIMYVPCWLTNICEVSVIFLWKFNTYRCRSRKKRFYYSTAAWWSRFDVYFSENFFLSHMQYH